jgi:hypothetical protein
MPRVVRLGRPANDNARSPAMLALRALALVLAVSLLAFVAWQVI